MLKCDLFSRCVRFLISHSETTPLRKITTSVLIFLNFHLLSNLVSDPQATLILFPSVAEMFLFTTVIRVSTFILLALFAWSIGQDFFKSVFIVFKSVFIFFIY